MFGNSASRRFKGVKASQDRVRTVVSQADMMPLYLLNVDHRNRTAWSKL